MVLLSLGGFMKHLYLAGLAFALAACSGSNPEPNVDEADSLARPVDMDPNIVPEMREDSMMAENAVAGVEADADAMAGRDTDTASTVSVSAVDERLAAARGITVDELNDPTQNYGYTADDVVFLAQSGLSPREARDMEKTMCAQGIDC
jgi:hypothetical protein